MIRRVFARWRTCCSASARRRKSTQTAGGMELKCPRCGFTQADFKKSGRLGCPECYQTFAEGLEGLLKTMHKGTRHIGQSRRKRLRQTRENADRLKSLQKKLAKADRRREISRQAAELRDEIKDVARRAPAKPVNEITI